MAKKKTEAKKSSRATKKRKARKKSTPKRHDHEHHEDHEVEIDLDKTERKAIDSVLERDDMRSALENEVNTAVTQAVRKVCKAHGSSLTVTQAQNVAMVLFGD